MGGGGGAEREMTYKNGMARALSILLTHEGEYFLIYCSRRSRTVSTDLSEKREEGT